MADAPDVTAPSAARLSRADLVKVAGGGRPPFAFPILARPIASHAGTGLAKLDDTAAVQAYLAEREEDRFYVSPFIDYAGADGLYRKQRVVLIKGRPFICHMAVSERWMVHYMNAGMTESAEKRAEEAAFMAAFETDFAVRHARAFIQLHERLGLDYFGIDCAETPDGRLLLFEADVAMIVHAMDPPDLFSYKQAPMKRLFAAFAAMLCEAA
jgi:glutathione synthase/RimK-type ligase-like ATP-grasp enzyme